MKYLIIGGVAGGASAAARLRRIDEQAEIIILEKGEYVSYANCGLPYYIGKVIQNRQNLLLQTPASFKDRFNIDVRIKQEAVRLDPSTKKVHIADLMQGTVYSESYDKLVLSPGAIPFKPIIPGIDLSGIFILRSVIDADLIKNHIQHIDHKKAVVVGAGFVGLEMAENLQELGFEVKVLEMGNQILAPVDFEMAVLAQKHLREKGVQLLLNTTVVGFEKKGNDIAVMLNNETSLEAGIVILSIGVKSDIGLAKEAGLEIGKAGSIKVNQFLQTSNPDIYAVGDAIEFESSINHSSMPTYLAGPANKQGRIAANNIVFGNTAAYHGSINTAIVKLFDLTIAVAGMASKQLTRAGISHRTVMTHSGSHAGYYPEADLMSMQLSFDPDSGRVLGAQIVGKSGVDKRIDVLSSVIQRGATITELTEFEHAYAPPYSSAKDPVNMIGFVAENLMTGKLKTISWQAVGMAKKSSWLIDVRTPEEFEKGHIPGAINLPVDTLRNSLKKLPKEKSYILYCQIGLRGYIAQRILTQHGYENVNNIAGGYKTWEACVSTS